MSGDDLASKCHAKYLEFRKQGDFEDIPEMTADDLSKAMQGDDKPVIVDVREDAERAISTIPGAISKADFEAGADGAYKGKTVVSYCTISYRSGLYNKELIKKGRGDIFNLADGVLGWTGKGLPIEADGKPTKKLHVMMEAMAPLAPSDIEASW